MPPATPAIEVEALTKAYGQLKAVDGVSFSVGTGEIFGMVGPNGAGKTTTIECLEGMRFPDGGVVRVLGLDPHARRSMWDLVRAIRERGKTVFLTTHYMEEAEHLCDRVLVIDHGRIVALDSPSNLVRSLRSEIRILFTAEPGFDPAPLRTLPGVSRVEKSGEKVIVNFLMTLFGGALLIVSARLVYGLRFEGRPLDVLLGFTLSTLSFFAVGFLLASVARTARTANILGMVLYFPNLFLSGATIPKQTFPPAVKAVSKFIPLTHVVNLLQGLWIGNPLGKHLLEIAVLAGLLVVGVAVSAKAFRWE